MYFIAINVSVEFVLIYRPHPVQACAREREVGRHPAEGFLQQVAALLPRLQGHLGEGEGDTIFFLSAYLLRNPEPHGLNMEVGLESLFGLHVT